VTIVQLDDLVTPERLSRYDQFHPGAAAYQAAAERIAKRRSVGPTWTIRIGPQRARRL